MDRIRIAAAVAALAVALTACGGSTEGLLGQELYERSCGACHARDGSGGSGPPLNEGSNAESLTDDQLAGAITVGPGTMPSFDRLSGEQVDSLVQYMRRLQSP
ncbi:MAG TPA: cytochrome c [Acidimicrobiia bacterium]|jgi:mono/diheme cytochrome c family protein|nr:cytochrome c [Acidimicrobiia bacterium]